MSVEAMLENKGELRIQTNLKRSSLGLTGTDRGSAGLIITIKAHPQVEEFMKDVGGGEEIIVTNVGRYWTPIDEDKPLRAYSIRPLEQLKIDSGNVINLDRLGQPLMVHNESRGGSDINMSFLRLIGISNGEGVSFLVKTVMSYNELCNVRDKIHAAQTLIYDAYMRPIDFTVTTSSQTLKY